MASPAGAGGAAARSAVGAGISCPPAAPLLLVCCSRCPPALAWPACPLRPGRWTHASLRLSRMLRTVGLRTRGTFPICTYSLALALTARPAWLALSLPPLTWALAFAHSVCGLCCSLLLPSRVTSHFATVGLCSGPRRTFSPRRALPRFPSNGITWSRDFERSLSLRRL